MAFDKDLLIRVLGDSTSLNNSLTDSEKRVKAFADKVGSIGQVMTVVGGAITAVSIGLIKMASDAEETSSKFATVFQDVSDEAAKTAKNLAVNFGLSTKAAKQLLSDTGDLLTGFGFTGEAALDLSTKVNELAVDLASFTNYSGGAEGASAALTKALLGERESVKSLGISIMETDVQAKVLELTQKGMTFETDRQAKAYATLFIAQEQSKNAIGDFSRTSEGFANQMRILKARLNDVAVALGEKLLPIATRMVGKVTEVVNHVNEWIEAHSKLVEWIVKTGAAVGAIALVSGPILMAVSAFMKMKGAIDLIIGSMNLLKIATTGAAGPFLLLAANVYLWLEVAKELDKVLHSTHTSAQDVTDAENRLSEAQQKLADKIGITVDELKEYQEQGFAVHEMVNGLKDATTEATGSFLGIADALALVNEKAGVNEWGQVIETYEEWAARLETIKEATKGVTDKILEMNDPLKYQIQLLEEEAEALRGVGVEESLVIDWLEKAKNKLIEDSEATKTAIALKEKLADMTKSLTDKIFEFTHTDEEIKLRDINREYNELVENAKEVFTNYNDLRSAIEAINEARQKEIDNISGIIDKNEELVEVNKEVAASSKEAGVAADTAAKTGIESWEGFTIQIKHATNALSNFTAEGIASAIANIKMKFYPALTSLKEDLSTTGFYLKDLVRGQIANVEEMMNEQINTVLYGLKVYNEAMSQMGNSGGTTSSFTVPSYSVGTPSVPRTQLAVVHQGEEINPPGQRSYDQRKNNYTTSINIEPGAIVIQTPKFNEQDGEKFFDMIEKKAKQRGLVFARG